MEKITDAQYKKAKKIVSEYEDKLQEIGTCYVLYRAEDKVTMCVLDNKEKAEKVYKNNGCQQMITMKYYK